MLKICNRKSSLIFPNLQLLGACALRLCIKNCLNFFHGFDDITLFLLLLDLKFLFSLLNLFFLSDHKVLINFLKFLVRQIFVPTKAERVDNINAGVIAGRPHFSNNEQGNFVFA